MGLDKYQKGDFTSSPVAVYQKPILNCLKPLTNISDYLNLWNIFRLIFRQIRMTFFIKLWSQKKSFSNT